MTDIDYKGGLKREASMGDFGGPAKRARSGGRGVDVRFLVQSKNAGAIIGKGGSNINRLRTEFSASVTVPDCPGPERILAISADIDTVCCILLDILPKLDDYSHNDDLEFDCELRMLLHQNHAGCLIGKGGSRIKELREKTGSNIKIFSNCCPNSTERVVQITGFPKVVVDCIKEINAVIEASPVKGLTKQYDPHNCSPMYAQEYGGFEESGGGRGGRGRGRGGGFRGGRGGGGPAPWRDQQVDNFSNRRGGRGGGGGGGGGGRWNQGNSGGGNLGAWVTPEAASSFQSGGRMMGNNSMNGSNYGGGGGYGQAGNKPTMRGAGGRGGFQGGYGGGGGFSGGGMQGQGNPSYGGGNQFGNYR